MLIMQKTLTKIFSYLRRLGGMFIRPDKDRRAALFDDTTTIEEFRGKVANENLEFFEAYIKGRINLDKEKLFCFNCFKLMSSEKIIPSIIHNYLKEMFNGHYDIKMSKGEAKDLYNRLTFTSKIFIQERNRSVKKLFIQDSLKN